MIFMLLLFSHVGLASEKGLRGHILKGATDCYESIFGTVDERFRKAMERRDWLQVVRLLERNHERVVGEFIAGLSREDEEKYRRHWAGMNVGYKMASPPRRLFQAWKMANLTPGSTIVDIGSGVGEPALIFGALDPDSRIVGFELVPEKVKIAKKAAAELKVDNVEFFEQDLSEPQFILPKADAYYLYNPAFPEVIVAMAEQIKSHSVSQKVKVISYGLGWTSHVFGEMGFPVMDHYNLGMGAEIIVFEASPETSWPEVDTDLLLERISERFAPLRKRKALSQE